MTRLKRGDYIRIRPIGKDEWCAGFVALTSAGDPQSAMILGAMFTTAGIGVVMGGLPLTIDYEKETVVSLMGDQYEIEVSTQACAAAGGATAAE